MWVASRHISIGKKNCVPVLQTFLLRNLLPHSARETLLPGTPSCIRFFFLALDLIHIWNHPHSKVQFLGGKNPKLYVKPLTVQEKLTSGTTAEKLYSPMWAICVGMKTALSYSSGFFPTCNFSPAAVQVLQWLERQVPFVCDWGLNPLFLHSLQA